MEVQKSVVVICGSFKRQFHNFKLIISSRKEWLYIVLELCRKVTGLHEAIFEQIMVYWDSSENDMLKDNVFHSQLNFLVFFFVTEGMKIGQIKSQILKKIKLISKKILWYGLN